MTTETLEAPAQTGTELQDLGNTDRCDRCPSQAYVRAVIAGMDLLFCGHHYAKHEVALAEQGAQILDRRERLSVSYSDVEATELA